MLNTITFYDEITIWWTKDEFDFNTKSYNIYLDGNLIGKTDKTYYYFKNLNADTLYNLSIEAIINDNLKIIKNISVKTKRQKNKIYITDKKYNAVGDGVTLNTTAIQKALDDCTENDVVCFPKGVFLSGALNIHSHTEIILEEGAILLGSCNVDDYQPKIWSRSEGIEQECYRSLLNMGKLNHSGDCNTFDIVIRGKGTINGNGKLLRQAVIDREKFLLKDDMLKNPEKYNLAENIDTVPARARGRLFNISNVNGIVIAGIKIKEGPFWNIHFTYSKNVVTYNCCFESHGISNGDGWDPDSSENCTIFNCVFDTGDDLIAIKSGKNPEGNLINRPTKNIYVFDCMAIDGHGMSIGSEISGGVENVYIWDCNFINTWYGIQVKGTKKRGGYVKNLYVDNCKTSCVLIWAVGYNDDGIGSDVPPVFSNYHFNNVSVYGTDYFLKTRLSDKMRYVFLLGFDDDKYSVQNVEFNTLNLVNTNGLKGIENEKVKNIKINNLKYIEEK